MDVRLNADRDQRCVRYLPLPPADPGILTAALYEGPVASALVSELNAAEGILTTADLSEYKPLQYEGLLKNYGKFPGTCVICLVLRKYSIEYALFGGLILSGIRRLEHKQRT